MLCPKCRETMQTAEIQGMPLARCPQCLGVWFQGDDYQRLRKAQNIELVDIGSAELGRQYDTVFPAPCPVCEWVMERVPEPSQPHITLDRCRQGHGLFFDAGEYRDYRSKSLGDLLKRLFA
jgi:Zn-finger nucleic acid-binding protein